MGFTQAIASCFSKYVTFKGRAARSEYWYWILFQIILIFIPTAYMFTLLDNPEQNAGMLANISGFINIISLALFLPSLAVMVRRLHDIGRSGWWFLINFIPLVGAFIFLYWVVKRGTVGPNDYGIDPLGATNGETVAL